MTAVSSGGEYTSELSVQLSRFVAALLPFLVLVVPAAAHAHVIPNAARIVAFLKPEGPWLRLLVRVPLEAMVDLTYPTRGDGDLLDLDRADRVLRELAALWIANNIDTHEGKQALPSARIAEVRASLAFDGSFASYDQALQHVTGPRLTNSVDFVWNQGFLDVLLEYPIASDRSAFAIHSRLSTLAVTTTTTLRFLPAAGSVRAFEFVGDPGLIALDPAWHQTAARFLRTGFLEILRGTDYWLFLFALVIPLKLMRDLLPVAVAFVVAEAITLSPSSSVAPDTLWFQPLMGFLIAMSILYLAIENGLQAGASRRWMMAFGVGLVLGFRFSQPLGDNLQFAGRHPLTSLAAFATGADVAQLLVASLLFLAVRQLFNLIPERAGTIILSLMAGDIAWHWMGARGALVARYQLQWPAMTPAAGLVAVTWLMDVVIVGAVFWLLLMAIRRYAPAGPAAPKGTFTTP